MARLTRRRITPTQPADTTPVPASLVAAATPVNLSKKPKFGTKSGGAWQSEAWDMFDQVGELKFVTRWLGNSLSRCSIVASDVDPVTGKPIGQTDDQAAIELARDIAGGPAGQAALLGRLATFLTVPGEGWIAIIHRTNPDGTVLEEWHVLSADEIATKGKVVELTLEDQSKYLMDPDMDTLTRIHVPHPRKAHEADSLVRGALPILRRIVLISQSISATAKSRLAGSGILVLPQEISMPVAQPPTGTPDPDAPNLPTPPAPVTQTVDANDVVEQLVEVAGTAISDPGSAAALVPLVMQAKGEHIKDIKHIEFGHDLAETQLKVEEAGIRRLSLELDIPQEVLLGYADSNHWSAWASEESSVRNHIAPLLTVICDALTDGIFRPLLKASGHPDPERVTLWFDTSALTARPDRSGDAKDAHGAGAISSEAYRREIGFDEDDAYDMTTDEGRQRWAWDLLGRHPELIDKIGHLVGLTPPPAPGVPAGDGPAAGVEVVPAVRAIPGTRGTERDTAPTASDTGAAARLMAGLCVRRALELAGKRLRTRALHTQLADIPIAETFRHVEPVDPARAAALIDGWDAAVYPSDYATARVEPARFRAAVEAAAIHALSTGEYREATGV